MKIREAQQSDVAQLLELYAYLKDEPRPTEQSAQETMREIVADKRHHLLVGEQDGRIISSCVLVIIPNMTRQCRPYGLIENVVTMPEARGRGCATALLGRACEIAQQEHCYKVMLLTGSKEQSTLDFYRRAGFNSEDKTAFIRWLF